MANELVKVNFHGQDIDCIKNDEGVWVSLRRLCENLGIALDAQRVKLQGKAWATITTIVTVAEDRKERELLMLHVDSVPMWLATIDAERVAEDVRPKVELYQRECAKVLRDYWFGGEAKNPRRAARAATPKFSPTEIYRFAKAAAKDLIGLGVKPDVAQMAALATVRNNTGIDIEPLRLGVPARKQEADLLIPTEIGEMLGGLSAIKVNQLLAERGMQERINSKWHLTTEGGKHGELVPVDASNGHKDLQIKWRPSVLELLRVVAPNEVLS